MVPLFASESCSNLLFWGSPGPAFQRDIQIIQPFTYYVDFTVLQRPSLMTDFSIGVRTWRPEEGEIPWSLISEETDSTLRILEGRSWCNLAGSSFPWGCPWSGSCLWAPRESRLGCLVISSLHKFISWSQETEYLTSTSVLWFCASVPRAERNAYYVSANVCGLKAIAWMLDWGQGPWCSPLSAHGSIRHTLRMYLSIRVQRICYSGSFVSLCSFGRVKVLEPESVFQKECVSVLPNVKLLWGVSETPSQMLLKKLPNLNLWNKLLWALVVS